MPIISLHTHTGNITQLAISMLDGRTVGLGDALVVLPEVSLLTNTLCSITSATVLEQTAVDITRDSFLLDGLAVYLAVVDENSVVGEADAALLGLEGESAAVKFGNTLMQVPEVASLARTTVRTRTNCMGNFTTVDIRYTLVS